MWRRALAALAPTSTYAAALIAQHAITAYRRHRPDPAWTTFFTAMEDARDHWYGAEPADDAPASPLDPRGIDRLQFLSDYGALRLGDVASLILCNGWTEPHEQEAHTLQLDGNTLVVAPDPFGGQTIELTVPARRLPAKAYASDDALRETWHRAPVEALHVTLRGAP